MNWLAAFFFIVAAGSFFWTLGGDPNNPRRDAGRFALFCLAVGLFCLAVHVR